MKWWIRLHRSAWYRGFWLLWFAGFGIFDLITGHYTFALLLGSFMAVIVMLWMSIDRNVSH